MIKEKIKEERYINERELDEIIEEKLSKLNMEFINKEPHPNKEREIHNNPTRPLKLHEHKKPDNKIIRENITFTENMEALEYIFEDEFTISAVIKTLKESPLEIQIITKIIISLYERINDLYGE